MMPFHQFISLAVSPTKQFPNQTQPTFINAKITSSAIYANITHLFWRVEGIGLDIAKCEKISNGSFKQGISAYLRYSCQFGGGYLKGQFSVTSDQIDEYVISVSILNVYVLDTLTSWIEEFKGSCETQKSFNLLLGYLFAGFIILLHLHLNEIIL